MNNLFAMSAVVLIACLCRSLPYAVPVPIVALALFTAAYVSNRRAAPLVFFGGLFIADLVFGLHVLTPLVYASLLPVLFIGFRLKRSPGGREIAGASVLGSLLFFFLTNLGVWALGGCDWIAGREIPLTLSGLAGAYAAALPALPAKMAADLLASVLLFGGLSILRRSRWTVGRASGAKGPTLEAADA